jgi:hypothetical protein
MQNGGLPTDSTWIPLALDFLINLQPWLTMEKTQHCKINIMFMKVENLDLVNIIEIFFIVYYTSNPFS